MHDIAHRQCAGEAIRGKAARIVFNPSTQFTALSSGMTSSNERESAREEVTLHGLARLARLSDASSKLTKADDLPPFGSSSTSSAAQQDFRARVAP
eukprot:3333036-Prymnesium_polylepis.4